MPPLRVLELQLVVRSTLDDPPRPRISQSAGERQVERPPDFVDEIVHVGFVAAVVVAGEEHPLAPVEEYPPREVDRADSPEMTAAIDVPREVVDHPQDDGEEDAAEPARLDAAESVELVRDVVVFLRGQLHDVADFRPMDDLWFRLLDITEHHEKYRGRDQRRREQK